MGWKRGGGERGGELEGKESAWKGRVVGKGEEGVVSTGLRPYIC